MSKGHYANLKTTLCCRCHKQPRRATQAYCNDCMRAYNREWCQRKRGTKPRPIKPVVGPDEKFCTKCERILPKTRFSKCRSKRDGLMSICKECDYFKKLTYKARNKAKVNEYNRVYARQWRAKNPEYNRNALAKSKRRRIARKMQQAAEALA